MFYFFFTPKEKNMFVYSCYGKQSFYIKKNRDETKVTNKQKPSKIMRQATNEWQLTGLLKL